MKRILLSIIATSIVLAFALSAHAVLYDRGGGMIYSDDMDVTWLLDAKWAVTSGYDTDGYMTWADANTWAQNLSYGGYEDWRLPTFDPDYNRGDVNSDPETAANLSELAYLRYVEIDPTLDPDFDPSPFINLIKPADDADYVEPWYWSGTTFNDPDTGDLRAWHFDFTCG